MHLRHCPWLLAGLLVPGLALTAPAMAQIIPDATLGNESTLVMPGVLVQGNLADQIGGGAIRGGNLFHSFLEFNIDAGQRVYFANPAGIEAILTRVTGGNPSSILGTLGVDGAADLFFINPNGLVFGENATLDIPGSFYASTAEAVPLGNGFYSATTPDQSTLLTVNPSAQFSTYLSPASGDIQSRGQLAAQGNLTLAANTLDLQGQVAAGGDLTLLGLDTVRIRDGVDAPFVGFAGGDLLVQGHDQVDIVALSHPDSGLYSYGNMVLRSGNPVGGDAYYWSGGNFRVETLQEDLGELFSPIDPVIRALGDVEMFVYLGGSLHILAGGSVNIGTAIITDADPGVLGIDFLQETITLSDGTVVAIDGGAQPTLDIRAGIDPSAIGLVPPGNVTGLDPDFLLLGFNATDAPTTADITVGDVFIDAPNGLVLLTNQYQPNPTLAGGNIAVTGEGIYGDGIDARGFGGQGGTVYLDARNDVLVSNGSIDTTGAGVVGDVVINAGNTVRIEQQDRRTVVRSSIATGETGTGGSVRIRAATVEVLGGAQLSASVFGNGGAGNVEITARDRVVFEGTTADGQFRSAAFSTVEGGATGAGGNVIIRTGSLEVLNGALLSASTLGNGNGGNVVIHTGSLAVTNGAQLQSSTRGTGNAGNVEITADDSVVFDNGDVSTSVRSGAVGNGGDVVIHTGSLEVLNGAQLSASTFGTGNAGDVAITARDGVTFEGRTADGQFPSAVFSRVGSGAVGNSGDVVIRAGSLDVLNGAQLSASTFGTGDAGNVQIEANDQVVFDNGDVFSRVESGAVGNGGDVVIHTGSLDVLNGAQLSASTFGTGDAGDVEITADESMVFDNGDVFTSVGSGAVGNGGDVVIHTGSLNVLNGAQLLANTSGNGDAGNVEIESRDQVAFDGRSADGRFGSAAFTTVDSGAIGTGGNVVIRTGSLAVTNGALLSTGTAGNGNAGNVDIEARDQVVFEGRSADGQFGSSATSRVEIEGQGRAGNVLIAANSLRVANGAVLESATLGTGNAGNVEITTQDGVVFDAADTLSNVGIGAEGTGGNVVIRAGSLEVLNGAELIASTAGTGDAGSVDIVARDQVNLQGANRQGNPSGIFTDNAEVSTGRSNSIQITAPVLMVQDGAVLLATTNNDQPGGDITLTLGLLEVLNGGQIVTGSLGAGPAGTIRINATEGILITGSDPNFANRVAQIPETALFVVPQSAISVQARGTGTAGNIILGDLGTTPLLVLDQGGRIVAESTAGDGGNIVLRLSDLLLLRNGSLISATAGTAQAGGDGGNITLTVPFIIAIREENSDIAADAFAGTGGNVTINARGIFGIEPRPQRTPFSDITASSELGISGVVTLNTLDTSAITNSLTSLDTVVMDTTTLTAGSCIARTGPNQGSFVVTGSGGLPLRPGDSAISSYPTGTVRTLAAPTATLQEPDGVYQLPDGRLVLSRACEPMAP